MPGIGTHDIAVGHARDDSHGGAPTSGRSPWAGRLGWTSGQHRPLPHDCPGLCHNSGWPHPDPDLFERGRKTGVSRRERPRSPKVIVSGALPRSLFWSLEGSLVPGMTKRDPTGQAAYCSTSPAFNFRHRSRPMPDQAQNISPQSDRSTSASCLRFGGPGRQSRLSGLRTRRPAQVPTVSTVGESV